MLDHDTDGYLKISRSWVETVYPALGYYDRPARGGHFAAWEEPELFSREIRAAIRKIR